MNPACPLCGDATRPWLTVPSDFFRPSERKAFSLYWCRPCAYGLVWPRPTASEVARFYELDGYYTHDAGDQPRAHTARPDLLDRLRVHLAWRVDRGLPMPDSVNPALARAPLSVCDIGRSLRGIARAANLELVRFEWTGYCRMFSEEWIGEETARWDHFASALDAQMPPRASKARAWALLARTAFSPPGRKYDSVRMVARSNW